MSTPAVPAYVPRNAPPDGERAPLRLRDCPVLADAVEAFLDQRSAVESSAIIKTTMADLELCQTADEIFAAALRAGFLPMAAALEWALFLHHAGAEAERLGEVNFTKGFDAAAALTLIGQVYDNGMKDNIYSCFEEASDDEYSEDDDYYSEEEAAPDDKKTAAAAPAKDAKDAKHSKP